MPNTRLLARLPLLALAVLGAALALALLQRGLASAAPSAAGVVIAPTAAAQSAPPGSTVTYTVRVTNTGSTADVFTMTVSGNVWPTSILVNGSGTGLLPLAPGAGQNVQIEVSIPLTATGRDVAQFTTVSQADPGVSAAATLTTSVLLRTYLPIISKN